MRDKTSSGGKPMQYTQSDWKAPPNLEAAKKQGARHPRAKNSINFAHFANAKTDKTNDNGYGTTIEKGNEQLAK